MKPSILESKKLSSIMKISLIILIVFLVVFSVYFALDRAGYIRAFRLGMQLQQQEQQQEQDKVALDSLKKIILLPGDDVEPTIATINDIEALKTEQPDFFANAKNGDRIIIYPTIAVIYDYEANQIIKVGPVQFQQTETEEPVEALEETNMEISQ